MFTIIWHSGKAKSMEIVKDRWWLGVRGVRRVGRTQRIFKTVKTLYMIL